MGSLYVAEQLGTGHQRALKLMHPSLAQDPRARERFAQEAQSAARIESEHVAQVVAAGVDPSTGTPWMAMELLRGRDLAATLAERGRLPVAEVVQIMRQLGHALAAAHRVGIVHRDLKPDNVFIADARRSDAAFTVKVLDFGIAKWLLENQPARPTTIVGSPLWMAPEQFDTGGGMIGPATDVWSLGLLAFTTLTGKLFWRSSQGEGLNVPALIAEITVQPTPPASQRAAELGVRDALPAGFDGWFSRCTSRAPHERFRDAAEAVGAFESVVSAPGAAGVAPTMAIPAAPAAMMAAGMMAGAMPPTGNAPSGTMAMPMMAPGVPAQSTAAAGTMAWPQGQSAYPSQPGMQNPYGSQPGMQNPYGSQPGMQNPYGSQPGMQNRYGSQPGFGPSPSGDQRMWGLPPGATGPSYMPPPSPVKRGGGGAVIAGGLVVLLAAGGAGAWMLTRTRCDDGQHSSHGHCCASGAEWNSDQERCEGGATTTTTTTPTTTPPPLANTFADAGALAVAPEVDAGMSPIAPTTEPAAPVEPTPAPRPRPRPAPDRHMCLGRWSGALRENTGSRGFMSGVVTGTRGTCGSWSETWTSGSRCYYQLTSCVQIGNTIRAIGRTSSYRCGNPVFVTMSCSPATANFRETARGNVVDTALLSRR
ncbi:MAG: protein kinase [Polyangiales bacterium]